MPNLKNITDLPVVESADGLNLIVENNGSAKRIAADKIEGKVKSVNGIMPDENGNVKVETASSWNDLTDKPFYEETVTVNEPLNITWDGNTEGLVNVEGLIYKISDLVLTDEQIKKIYITASSTSTDPIALGTMWEQLVSEGHVTEDCVAIVEGLPLMMFVRKDNVVYGNTTLPEKGIYSIHFNNGNNTIWITSITTDEPIEHTKTAVKKIAKKFLPEEVKKREVTYYKAYDGYLCYWNTTEAVSMDEFFKAYSSGDVEIGITGGDLAYLRPIYIGYGDEYATVIVYDGSQFRTFYTSEYVEAAPPV